MMMSGAKMTSVAFSILFLVLTFSHGFECLDDVLDRSPITTVPGSHRKLLGLVQPNRIWGDKCSKADIVVTQGQTAPLPSGIPTYTVEIMNVCSNGCSISGIHLTCGKFGSARLINPNIFKRVRENDCLVNDGKPLLSGRSLSFQYANSFSYPLAVESVQC